MWFLLLWGMGLLTSVIYFFIYGFPHNLAQVCNVLLLHQFVVTFGLVGVIGFIVNIILADKTAKQLGWSGGPFQIKYGFSQLGLGVMGVLAIWFRGYFWIATIVNMYIYGLSGFWTHTEEMFKHKKLDAGHISNLIMDVLYQAFITALSITGGLWR